METVSSFHEITDSLPKLSDERRIVLSDGRDFVTQELSYIVGRRSTSQP